MGSVELTTAMVRDDDRIRACADGCTRIFFIQDALEDQLATPAFLDPFDILPG